MTDIITKDTSVQSSYHITLYKIDEAIQQYIENVIKPQCVDENDSVIQVPV
jgi:hypothetical protein